MPTEYERRRALWALAEAAPLSEAQYRRHRAAIEAGTVTYKQISAKAGVHLPRLSAMRWGSGDRERLGRTHLAVVDVLTCAPATAAQIADRIDCGMSYTCVVVRGLMRGGHIVAISGTGRRGSPRVYAIAGQAERAA